MSRAEDNLLNYLSKSDAGDVKESLEHIPSEDCWCEPVLISDYESEGGVKHYLHRELQ